MSRRKASIYSIASNHSRAIESDLLGLADVAKDGGIRGITYVISNRHNEIEVASSGSHQPDPDKAIGAMFRAAMTLVMSA